MGQQVSNFPNGFPNGLSQFGIRSIGPNVFGKVWFVYPQGRANGTGGSVSQAFNTMEQALDAVGDNDVIYFWGKVREQLVAPLGVQGVTIIGAAGGQVRDDDGAKWYAPASPVAGQALLELREQGWSMQNFLMTPDSTAGACIKAHRAESATYPDSSHFQAINMRFVGAGGYGIQDVGGNSNYLIQGCKFQSLAKGIYCSSTAIAVPTRNQILNNEFYGNDDDIESSLIWSTIEGNRFHTAGDGTHTVINSASNSGQGSNNIINLNWFNNAAADIDPAHGFTGTTTDLWSNYTNNQAALQVGQPA